MTANGTMLAAVLHGREDVRLERVPVPALEPGDVLVRTAVALTCGTDVKVYRRGYHARMIVPPALFGHEMAGTVEAAGAEVEGFAPGLRVVAANSAPCEACSYCERGRPNLCDDLLFWNGAYAELVRVPARVVRRNLLRVPDGVSLRRAAMVEPLACALRGVEESGIETDHAVAVIGAGAIGLMCAVLAQLRGAHVVVAGRNSSRLERARRLGTDVVAAGPGDDLADVLRRRTKGGRGYDVVIEAVGVPETGDAAIRALRKGGTVNLFGGCPAGTVIGLDAQRLHYEELTVKATFHHTPDAVRRALELIASGQVDADAFVTGEAPLERLPVVLQDLVRGSDGLKTAILPAAGAAAP